MLFKQINPKFLVDQMWLEGVRHFENIKTDSLHLQKEFDEVEGTVEFSNCFFESIFFKDIKNGKLKFVFNNCQIGSRLWIAECALEELRFQGEILQAQNGRRLQDLKIKLSAIKSLQLSDIGENARVEFTNVLTQNAKIENSKLGSFVFHKDRNTHKEGDLHEIASQGGWSDPSIDYLTIRTSSIKSISLKGLSLQRFVLTNIHILTDLIFRDCRVGITDLSYLYSKSDRIRIDGCYFNTSITLRGIRSKLLEVNNSDLSNLNNTIFSYEDSHVDKVSQELTSWPRQVSGDPTARVRGNRLLKTIAEDEKDDFSYAHYRFKEHVNQAIELWNAGGFENRWRAINLRIPQLINSAISNNGEKLLKPFIWLFSVHLLLTFWMVNTLGISGTDEYINIYAVTILPTHKLSWDTYEFSPVISILMRLFSSLFIYHIVWASRKMNKGS